MSNQNENNAHIEGGDEQAAGGMEAYQALGEFLEADGWHPQAIAENHVYRSMFIGDNGEVTCFAQVRPDLQQFIFYVVMPMRVPAEMRVPMAEFLTRANYGLRIGNFEMDFDDGEVRYKSSVDFEGISLSPLLMRNTIYPAVQTMDRYLPGILKVIYGGSSPESAISAIEEQE